MDAGRLTGDARAIALVLSMADDLEGERIGPVEGPYTTTAHLREPVSALLVIVSAFVPERYSITGDVPEQPPIPDSAIG